MSIIWVVIIRSVISFFALLIFVRLIGKQQMAELTFFDYVVGITIGSIASTLSVQVNQNTLATLAGMGVWTILPILIAYICLHNVWFRKLVEGEATIVIAKGKILEKNLARLRLTIDDLLFQLRTQGVFSITDVEYALFESNGKLSVQKKSTKRNLTPEDIGITPAYEGLPINLIKDGIVLEAALSSLGLTKAWLYKQLAKVKITDVKEVSLAQIDTQGNLYVDTADEGPFYTISTKKQS